MERKQESRNIPYHALLQESQKLGRWLEQQSTDLSDARQQVKEEVSRRKQAEENLYQLQKAVDMMQLGITITNLDGNIIYINPAQAEMHGYTEQELLGQKIDVFTPPAHQKPLTLESIKSWKGLIREGISVRKNSTTFPVRLLSEVLKCAEGEPCAIVTSSEDISERKHTDAELKKYRKQLEEMVAGRTTELMATNEILQQEILEHQRTEAALQKSQERYRIVLEAVPDPIMVYDRKGEIAYLNPAFSRIFGWTLHDVRRDGINFIPIEHLDETRIISSQIQRGKTISGIESYRLTKGGERVNVSISGAGFFDDDQRLQGSVITLQDITARKKTEEEIRFLAYHDDLTSLPNRKSFYMRLEDTLLQSQSHGRQHRRTNENPWAVLFLDLDKFKNVNDTLGHDVGDDLLQKAAKRLQDCVRKSDYIFRLGGDEFTVILTNLTHDTDVVKVTQKIRHEIAQPYTIQNHEVYVTVSVGISVYPIDGQDVETLVKNADIAMYAAKENRQGYRIFSSEMNTKAQERMNLENNLRTALQNKQLAVYYQPIANHHNDIIGMEALLRWHHPELGIISPTKFIPIAEENGFIASIGEWVLQTACRQAKDWQIKGYHGMCVAVNLSAHQFKETDLIETVEQTLRQTGLASNCLKLEITESSLMEQPDQAIATMNYLRSKGIHFSIDDFGTGYSSLSYLKRLPIDILKIDRSFVMDAPTNKDDREIIKTIIAMARNLNMNTLAEGVETKDQQTFLTQNGCQMMQGYYFGRPMPAEQFEHVLQNRHSPFAFAG